ncbi:MAG: MlaD family protein [Burkholderiales bacterium]|nr:MlaD family protein [Burkholderiales bacterium]
MSAKPNYFKLGLFVLAGLAVAVAMVLALGAGKLFERTITMETYVDDSVQGLDLGSKVRYRGVLLGEVKRLGFTAERYEQDKPLGQRKPYVLIEATLNVDQLGPLGRADADLLKQYIEQGLRVRVAPQGITGINYLELDFVEPTLNPPLPINWQPRKRLHSLGPREARAVYQSDRAGAAHAGGRRSAADRGRDLRAAA